MHTKGKGRGKGKESLKQNPPARVQSPTSEPDLKTLKLQPRDYDPEIMT